MLLINETHKKKYLHLFPIHRRDGGKGDQGRRLPSLTQPDTKIYRKSYLKTLDDIRIAVEDVAKRPGLIVFTLMHQAHIAELNAEVERRGLESFDVITPIIEKMQEFLGIPAKSRRGLSTRWTKFISAASTR